MVNAASRVFTSFTHYASERQELWCVHLRWQPGWRSTRSYYRPQTKFAKVMFLHVSVILSTGGGSASVHVGIPPPGDTVNERAVCILLECNLVTCLFCFINLVRSMHFALWDQLLLPVNTIRVWVHTVGVPCVDASCVVSCSSAVVCVLARRYPRRSIRSRVSLVIKGIVQHPRSLCRQCINAVNSF